MAAALVAHYAGDRVVVRSAGTAPADTINPTVVDAMHEIGIDLDASRRRAEASHRRRRRGSDVVITMGCGDACPYYPGKRYEDWQLDDPAGQPLEVVRPSATRSTAEYRHSSPNSSRAHNALIGAT